MTNINVDFKSRILRFRRHNVGLASLAMVFMWSVHLRSSKIVTARYLADGTRSKLIHILEGWFVPGHMNDLAF